jgi:hypothetical protein
MNETNFTEEQVTVTDLTEAMFLYMNGFNLLKVDFLMNEHKFAFTFYGEDLLEIYRTRDMESGWYMAQDFTNQLSMLLNKVEQLVEQGNMPIQKNRCPKVRLEVRYE